MLRPEVPPEKRPSVSRAHSLPRCMDLMYVVGYSISCMPGPRADLVVMMTTSPD